MVERFNIRNLLPAYAVLVWICILVPNSACAQKVSMALDTSEIALGDQTVLTIAAIRDPMNGAGPFVWPVWEDTLTRGLEIIKVQELDTVAVELPNGNAGILVAQQLIVTHWDSGVHTISPIPLIWKGDTILSNAVILKVTMPQVGKAGEIAGHAPIRQTEWSWQERMQQWLPGLLASIAILAFGAWTWRKWKQRVPFERPETIVPKAPLEAAHVIALRTLENIKKTAIWKNGQVKLHHAATSEALRLYLEQRFDFPALERSTSEVKDAVGQLPLRQLEIEALIEVLTLADLVKFAKWNPNASDHERVVNRSIRFVENTIPSVESNEAIQR